jgi:hypothetical protein
MRTVIRKCTVVSENRSQVCDGRHVFGISLCFFILITQLPVLWACNQAGVRVQLRLRSCVVVYGPYVCVCVFVLKTIFAVRYLDTSFMSRRNL